MFFSMFPWFSNRCVFGLPFSSFPVLLHRFSSDSRRSRFSRRLTFAPWVQAMTTLGGPIALMKARQPDSWVTWVTRVTLCKILYDIFMNVMILWNPLACKAHSSKVFEYCAREAPDMAGYILGTLFRLRFSLSEITHNRVSFISFSYFSNKDNATSICHRMPYVTVFDVWCPNFLIWRFSRHDRSLVATPTPAPDWERRLRRR